MVFQNRCPKELYPRKIRETAAVLDLLCDSWIWESQEGICNHAFLFYTGETLKAEGDVYKRQHQNRYDQQHDIGQNDSVENRTFFRNQDDPSP